MTLEELKRTEEYKQTCLSDEEYQELELKEIYLEMIKQRTTGESITLADLKNILSLIDGYLEK